MLVLFLIFWGISIVFSTVAAPIYDLTDGAQELPFLHIFSPTFICYLLYNRHSDRCTVMSHCGFDLHFPDNSRCWASFHVSIGHLYVFWKNVYSGPLPILNWVVCLFWCWLVGVLCIFWILTPYGYIICKYLFPFSKQYFCFVDGFLGYAQAF